MTERLPVTLAVGDYDLTAPLIRGEVSPQGVALTVLTYPTPQRNWRMVRNLEFDVAEISLASYVARRSRGIDDIVAIPVFLHRRFRHGYVFLPAASAARTPKDFRGGRIGVRIWANTAAVWVRGILAEYHGLALGDVTWVAQDREDVPFELDLPTDVLVERVPDGATVTGMCAAGEIQALVYPEIPRPVLDGDGTLRRLFADFKEREMAYFRDTGIFPIMHVLGIRSKLVDANPWLPRNLLEVFNEAKCLAMRRLEDPRTVSLAWSGDLHEEERRVLGPDPWEYGLSPTNRATLDTFLEYSHRDGVARKRLIPEELFHPASIDELPSYL